MLDRPDNEDLFPPEEGMDAASATRPRAPAVRPVTPVTPVTIESIDEDASGFFPPETPEPEPLHFETMRPAAGVGRVTIEPSLPYAALPRDVPPRTSAVKSVLGVTVVIVCVAIGILAGYVLATRALRGNQSATSDASSSASADQFATRVPQASQPAITPEPAPIPPPSAEPIAAPSPTSPPPEQSPASAERPPATPTRSAADTSRKTSQPSPTRTIAPAVVRSPPASSTTKPPPQLRAPTVALSENLVPVLPPVSLPDKAALTPPKPAETPPPVPTTSTTARETTSAPVPAPAAAPATPPATPAAPTAEAAIQAVLDRYRLAYDARDADAVGVAWPMANTKALSKAFAQLDQQKLQFDHCSIKPAGVLAEATCTGKAMYVPKVGNKTEHIDARQWTFELRLYNGVWSIASVQSK